MISRLSHPNNRAIIKDTALDDKVFDFFMINQGDEEEIKNLQLEFIAGEGYTLKNIEETESNLFTDMCVKSDLKIDFIQS